ncbi:MAG: hypothetical protein HOP21_00130 [Methylotenera sp.]|nr:hypothetical protein [Methylotenera sp.]
MLKSFIFLCLTLPSLAWATCDDSTSCQGSNWRLSVGFQHTHRSPTLHYAEKNTADLREVTIEEDFTEKKYLPFPTMQLEYRINSVSTLDLTYHQDDTETSALQHRTIKFLFFPVRIGLRVPLQISTQSLKLRYQRALFQNDAWEIGGSLGLQMLKLKAETDIPTQDKLSEEFTTPLPELGLYVSYMPTDAITYRLATSYLPLKFDSIKGNLAEVNASLAYQFNQHYFLGVGYRYAHLDLDFNREKYQASVSHVTYGPTAFVGFNF